MVHMSLFLKRKPLGKEDFCGKRKKGQTEMIGLVIIMILIVIGALFYVRFVVLGKSDSELKHKSDTIQSIQVYNLMNAIMNIEICENILVREGIAMCKNKETICNEEACKYLDSEISKIVNMAIYKDFSLNINSSGDWSHSFGKDCKFGISSYAYKYNLKGDYYNAVFKLCEKTLE